LAPYEILTCFANFGTASRQPKDSQRRSFGHYTSTLTLPQ
jgi:hypothetical protein